MSRRESGLPEVGAYDALEFAKVVELFRRYVFSPLGAARLDDLLAEPRLESATVAETEFATVGEAVEWFRELDRRGARNVPAIPRFDGIEDIGEPLGRLALEEAVLEALEVRAVLAVLEAADGARVALLRCAAERPQLGGFGRRLPDFKPALAELGGRIQPDGEVSSLASTALSRIRRRLERQRQAVETSLLRFVRKHAATGVLQEKYVTMRNGRTVVPVKANWKSRVEGIVHGASATGQTVFVEPLDTIVQNNRLVRLREEEHAEILRILREMSRRLRTERPAIVGAVRDLGDLEYVFARARFWREFQCCRPRFSVGAEPRIVLEGARHPLLQDLLERQRQRPVPLSLRLEAGHRTLIVSGPNAGGKTVVLKTLGVLAAMAQAGLPVPADDVELPWFDGILADIGDAQSISESLSTFSAHVAKLAAILERATAQSLVVLDELGTATDPEDGGALAVAVVERLGHLAGFTAVSTHLPELKMYGVRMPGVLSASLGLDEETRAVTYRLRSGIPGSSVGLDMARSCGMPEEVIQRARELKGHGGEQAERYLEDLGRRAQESEAAALEARQRNRDLQRRQEELEREAAARAEALRSESERRVADLTRKLERRFRKALDAALKKLESAAPAPASRAAGRRAAQDLAAFRRAASAEAGAALGNRASAAPALAPGKYQTGARVRILSMGVAGEIAGRLDAVRWEVVSGSMRLQVAAEDLALDAEPPAEPRPLPPGVRLQTTASLAEAPSEINVIGKSADEALLEVDRFLDRAVLANKVRLRVIHGFGKDILRRELWRMFAQHVHVAKYYQAEQHEGGTGATIVEVRDS